MVVSSVILGPDLRARVVAFGRACRVEEPWRPDTYPLSRWPPDVVISGHVYDSHSDVWSWGVLVTEVLSNGCPPFATLCDGMSWQPLLGLYAHMVTHTQPVASAGGPVDVVVVPASVPAATAGPPSPPEEDLVCGYVLMTEEPPLPSPEHSQWTVAQVHDRFTHALSVGSELIATPSSSPEALVLTRLVQLSTRWKPLERCSAQDIVQLAFQMLYD
jgi:hypothetical protein